MTVGGDGDQLVSGAAPEFQDTPALPIGLGPVELDGRLGNREQPVIQPRVGVEPLTHEAHSPWPGWNQASSHGIPMHVRHCPEPAGRPPRAFVHAPAHRLTARISAVAPVVAGATQVRSHWLLTKAHTSRTALPCGMLSGCVRMGSWRWSRSPVDRRARRPAGSGRTYDCLLSVVRLRDGPRGSPRTVHRRIVQLDVEVPLLMTPVV